ncbi:predicted protein, partial [Phaeodactylum tricornutum CCAP 1055/1]
SGLGNLGNTCFMNSTLQCLAHTHPLKRYFLSGEYGDDLNRNNPLGTGGDLATQFAQLMMDIWITTAPPRNFLSEASTGYDSSSSLANNVVYPRNFKYTLGKHAERFVGYDQHDSQELATYLLDALHEDTNLVTKKPYVEKPEQKDTESDQEAADNAWELHLKRENSKVLENFMGQIKSRVQCCKANCNRVSTTFDPFMYLSVPIPGSMERILKVTYVPMNPQQRMQKLEITISKMATMKELFGLLKTIDDLALEDTCAVDIWHQEVYSWYEPKNEVDRIRDNDYTFLYELAPLAMVKAMGQTVLNGIETDDDVGLGTITKHYQLDLATMTKLNSGDDWSAKLSTYLQNPTMLHNSSRDNCSELVNTSTNEEDVLDIIERCESSAFLENVRSRHDLAILEFIASKMRKEIVSLENQQTTMYPDGVIIQIHIRKATLLSGNHRTDECVARKSSNATTVLDCIEKYCQMEQLEDTEMWYCNKCKDHVRAWKQTHLYRCPPILIVHLKRFQYSSSTHRRDKIGLFIDFPLEGLDLTSVALHWTGAEKPLYDCYAVSNHYGGLGGGHYTAYALNDDKVWCHYDDSRVTANVEPEEVVSEAAYVLYYRR